MHEIDGTLVDTDISLNWGALCITSKRAAAIKASEKNAHTPVHSSFKNGIVDIKDHSGDNDITNGAEPSWVEVGNASSGQTKSTKLFRQIGVYHKEQEGGVEELHDESDCGSLGKTNSLSIVTNPVNKHNATSSEDDVETDE